MFPTYGPVEIDGKKVIASVVRDDDPSYVVLPASMEDEIVATGLNIEFRGRVRLLKLNGSGPIVAKVSVVVVIVGKDSRKVWKPVTSAFVGVSFRKKASRPSTV